MEESKRVLVTGASGVIGTNLIDELLELGHAVIGVAKQYPLKEFRLPQFQHPNYHPFEGDILDDTFLTNVFTEFEPSIIVHLAAQAIVGEGVKNSAQTFETNIKGTWSVLEQVKCLKRVEKVIVASSDKAYGKHTTLPYQETFKLKAKYPYDISKKITEELALSYYHTYQMPIIISRCGNVFGPYDLNWSRIVPGTIRSCIEGNIIQLRSDGKQERCYVYAKDVSSAYIRMIESPNHLIIGEAFNIGNDVPLSVLQIVESIASCFQIDFTKHIQILDEANYEIERQYLDCSKAKLLLGWEPKYDFSESIKETINWYIENQQVNSQE